MIFSKSALPTVVMFVVICLPNRVYAYLDPGTGSMVVQAVLAAVAAVGVSIGIFWRRVKSIFSRKSEKNGSVENDR